MLNKEDWMYINTQRERGVYIKDIATELGVHPKTISRALRRGGPPSGKRSGGRKSRLDPYKPLIDGLLREGVWNAVWEQKKKSKRSLKKSHESKTAY